MRKIIAYHIEMFDSCKHMLWLIKQMIVNFLKGDIDGAIEAIFWMKVHWNYKSIRIK